MQWLRLSVAGALVFMLVGMLGCGVMPTRELSAEQRAVLEQRVRDRWAAVIARDFEKAWEFTTPNYRKVFPKHLYLNKFSYSVDWELTRVEVVHYDPRAAVASVAVRVMSKPTKQTSVASSSLGAIPVTINERWINIDGQWWYGSSG